MALNLSYNTNGWVLHPLKKALKAIAKYGYTGVDLLCEPPFAYPPILSKNQIRELRKTLSSLGLELVNASANRATPLKKLEEDWAEPSLANPNKSRSGERVKYVKQVIDLALELEAKQVSVVSGYFRSDPEILWPKFIENLSECVDYAATHRMKIAVEPEPSMLVEFTDEAIRITEEIGSKWLGVQFDICHSVNKGENPKRMIEKLKARNKLFHIHIEDARGNKHFHLIPGTGDLDLRGFINTLEKIEYSGYLSVELYTYPHVAEQATKQSIEYLKHIITKQSRDSGCVL